MSQNNKPGNPYAAAAGAYGQHSQAHTPDQREMEARVLLKAARRMQDLQASWNDDNVPEALEDVLFYNRQIWMMFVDTAVEDDSPDRPLALRNNIANLGLFIFKHTMETLATPKKEKLDILISINRDIAGGLMKKPDGEPSAPPSSSGGTIIDG